MLPVDNHWVCVASIIIDAHHLLEELLRDRRTDRLTIHARADLTERERLKRLADCETLGHIIGLLCSDLNRLTISAKRCFFICCIHLTHYLSSPRKPSITTPSIPSLTALAVALPGRALLVDLVTLKVREHSAHSLR